VLLFVALLATLMLWLVGLCGRALDWARRFQANTVRSRPVLSTIFLGRHCILHAPSLLPRSVLSHAWRALKELAAKAQPA